MVAESCSSSEWSFSSLDRLMNVGALGQTFDSARLVLSNDK